MMNLQVVMKRVIMEKHHYLLVDKEDIEAAADLEAHPEVTLLALEALAECDTMAEGEAVVMVEDDEQHQLQHI